MGHVVPAKTCCFTMVTAMNAATWMALAIPQQQLVTTATVPFAIPKITKSGWLEYNERLQGNAMRTWRNCNCATSKLRWLKMIELRQVTRHMGASSSTAMGMSM
eukprot:scaffold64842_cov53-Attheya_sp.AAC.2